ncbi:hypothetical protein KAR91_05555 [Candidatus Pacearchaeota archaeon]|nr:hypothetical protein [Candidatus Pacearchaeota archaeon]
MLGAGISEFGRDLFPALMMIHGQKRQTAIDEFNRSYQLERLALQHTGAVGAETHRALQRAQQRQVYGRGVLESDRAYDLSLRRADVAESREARLGEPAVPMAKKRPPGPGALIEAVEGITGPDKALAARRKEYAAFYKDPASRGFTTEVREGQQVRVPMAAPAFERTEFYPTPEEQAGFATDSLSHFNREILKWTDAGVATVPVGQDVSAYRQQRAQAGVEFAQDWWKGGPWERLITGGAPQAQAPQAAPPVDAKAIDEWGMARYDNAKWKKLTAKQKQQLYNSRNK